MVKRKGFAFLKSILFHSLSHFSKAPETGEASYQEW